MKEIKQLYNEWRLSKYYQSIRECPMYNWVMMYEENNLRYLSKTGKVCKRINIVYEVLQDQMIDEFGINEDLLKIIKNKIKIEILYADQIETGDKSTGWKIEFLELDNQELMSKQTKTDFYLQTFEIQKHLPYKIDTKTMSIFEYYKNMKIIANKMKHEK